MTPEIVFKEGFVPKGEHNDVLLHTQSNTTAGNFISTSPNMEIANDFAKPNGYVYEIETSNYIDVNSTYGEKALFPEQNEFSIPGGIKPSEIKGAWVKKKGQLTGEFIPNPGFKGGK